MIQSRYLLVAALLTAALILFQSQGGVSNTRGQLFDSWTRHYSKVYADSAEYQYRLGVWLYHYDIVEAHNAKYIAGEESFEMEMNQFADLPTAEFKEKYLMKDFMPSATGKCNGK